MASLPVLAGLYGGATMFGESMVPWRAVMVDLDVYRQAGLLLLRGGDIYDLPGQLPFLYPPFAALLAVPLALLPTAVLQIGWTVAGVLCVLAVLHRFGLTGWVLSLVGTATVLFVEPVRETLAFGQLGIFLVALVLLDLAPGPRLLAQRRLLPTGALTAVAAAIKLTPGIFLLYLLASGRRRAALTMVLTGLAVTVASALIAPGPSATFWGRLARGDTGLGNSIIYYTNQSVMADVVRVFGLSPAVAMVGLALSGAVAVIGVWAAAWWHRLGEVRLAVTLCGVASLLASPVSWLHHFVWVVPLALCLLEGSLLTPASGRTEPARPAEPPLSSETARSTDAARSTEAALPAGPGALLPVWFRVLGWVFVGWVILAPFTRLPNGADVELTWTLTQNALASTTAALGLALLVSSVGLAGRRRGQRLLS